MHYNIGAKWLSFPNITKQEYFEIWRNKTEEDRIKLMYDFVLVRMNQEAGDTEVSDAEWEQIGINIMNELEELGTYEYCKKYDIDIFSIEDMSPNDLN